MMILPTAVEPVNAILSTSGCSTIAAPVAPAPVTILTTPGGRPASRMTSASLSAVSGVVSAFLGAAGIFGGAALYGFVTKRDLTSLGGILFMGLIGLIVVMIVQLFLFPGNSTMNLLIGIGGVAIFTGLTAWDVQRLKNGALPNINKDSATVMGALMLYLDFINLFLFMLRIFGSSR